MHRREREHATTEDEALESARSELQRAYMLVSFGRFDEALEACRRADAVFDGDHYLPRTLAGSFLISKGEIQAALKVLREVVDEHPDEALPRIHFAEACFLDGRIQRGSEELEAARERDDGRHDELIEQLDDVWGGLDAEEIPPPVEVAE